MNRMLSTAQQDLKLARKRHLVTALAAGDELAADELRLLLKVQTPATTLASGRREGDPAN